MDLYTIDCKTYILNGTEKTFGEEKTVETDNKEIRATFFIECNNMKDNFSYKTEYYGDGEMSVNVNRCNLEVYIKENKTPYDKDFTIKCTHSNDINTYIEIQITQKAEEFKLEITDGATLNSETNQYEKMLQSIIQNPFVTKENNDYDNYDYYEKNEIKINVVGGSKKYRIESILKCFVDEDSIRYGNFDNGFIYNKYDDKLIITNYGRPFSDENGYYLLRLCHEDYREVSLELLLKYNQLTRVLAKKTTKSISEKKIQPQISDIYLPYNTIIEKYTPKQLNIEEEQYLYEIKFNEDIINDEIIIENQKTDVVLSFEVLKNGEESDLMVKTFSSAKWCSVKTDYTNRKLLISIYDKPVGVRKSFIKVSIIDFPEIYKSFIVKNIKSGT